MKEKIALRETEEELKTLLTNKNMIRIKLNDQKICLAHDGDRWIAFEEACPHLGVSLAGGHITPFGEVACSWHGYRFNLFDGQEAGQRCRDLKLYEVVNEKGTIYLII